MKFIQNKIAERLGGINFGKETKLYKFARIKKAKEEAKELHPNIKLFDKRVFSFNSSLG